MERIAYIMRLKPDMVQAYKEAHQHVWPELIEAGNESGSQESQLFRPR